MRLRRIIKWMFTKNYNKLLMNIQPSQNRRDFVVVQNKNKESDIGSLIIYPDTVDFKTRNDPNVLYTYLLKQFPFPRYNGTEHHLLKNNSFIFKYVDVIRLKMGFTIQYKDNERKKTIHSSGEIIDISIDNYNIASNSKHDQTQDIEYKTNPDAKITIGTIDYLIADFEDVFQLHYLPWFDVKWKKRYKRYISTHLSLYMLLIVAMECF